jgi:PAS domain S-box-containing protein/putative nucleotidyltransferase with HDIG domain
MATNHLPKRKIVVLWPQSLLEITMARTATSIKVATSLPVLPERALAQSLQNPELRYRRLFEAARDGILILNADTGSISDVNPYLIEMLGYSREEFVEKKLWEVGAFKDVEASRASFLALQKDQFIRYDDLPLKAKSGRLIQVEFVSNVYLVGDEKVIQCNIRDISDRKAAEAALRAKEQAHWSLIRNLEDHWLLIKQLPVGVVVHGPDTRIVLCNPEASHLLGVSSRQILGRAACDPDWRFEREDGSELPEAEYPVNQVIASGVPLKHFVMGIAREGQAAHAWVLVNAYPTFAASALSQVVVTFADITEIRCAEKLVQQQLEHLTALVEIDHAINFSFDLDLSLTTLLTHAMVQLQVDAACVLLFNPAARSLGYVAGRGFRTRAVAETRRPLAKGYAGKTAREPRSVRIVDLAKRQDGLLEGLDLSGEDFVSYFGIPLIAKGKFLGVLEVFRRTSQAHREGWLDFLQALASQAAIAIDNATLFENLQKTNTELSQAYDATIEGWSRAMEMRDHVTEGHTHRAAVLTVKLGRLFEMSEAELVQVRWGALLHDIGKMAIPDHILFKEEDLTEAEWVIMKKHTIFACKMLSPIRYLRLALDIPCSHHEKWDGTGYPLGLKGEQIPLAARIFAVVDVWDALRSDRHYRRSWPLERVREHLRSLAGTHFDPRVVKVCLDSDILTD